MIWDKEIMAYAERKLVNKPWGLVVNNVKFKQILRMFPVVKRGAKYVENLWREKFPKAGMSLKISFYL